MELAGFDNNSDACGLIGWSTLNLTLSGCVAWLSQAYGVILKFADTTEMSLNTSTHGLGNVGEGPSPLGSPKKERAGILIPVFLRKRRPLYVNTGGLFGMLHN